MKKSTAVLFGMFISTLGFQFSIFAGTTLTADEIVVRADAHRMPQGTIVFQAEVTDYEKNQPVRESKYAVTAKTSLASLVQTTFPERQVGRKLLMERENLWLYTPDLRRAARVSLQQRLTGEISNGDLARTNFAGDYQGRLLGVDSLDGGTAYHLELKAKHSGITYAQIEYWVSTKDFLPKKAIFYAVSGKVMKRGVYLEPKTTQGRTYITRVDFFDAIDSGRHSTLLYKNCKSTRLPASVFSKEALGDSL